MRKVSLFAGLSYDALEQSYVVVPPDDVIGEFKASMGIHFGPFDDNKVKKPTSNPAIPWEFSFIIGRIATTWRSFECLFDTFLASMLVASRYRPERDWTRMNFRKRRELFRDQVRKCFDDHQEIKRYLLKLCDDAGESYWKRNATIHWRIKFGLQAKTKLKVGEPFEPECYLEMSSRHNGRDVMIRCNYQHLEGVFYDITHLHGRLNFIEENPVAKNPMLSSHDISLLRGFFLSNRQNPPTD
jgi:hypothetical protein